MTPDEAQALADRTLAAIDADPDSMADLDHATADRERVASDLAGLREHQAIAYSDTVSACAVCDSEARDWDVNPCPDARRYADNLRRTARLYGVEVPVVTGREATPDGHYHYCPRCDGYAWCERPQPVWCANVAANTGGPTRAVCHACGLLDGITS